MVRLVLLALLLPIAAAHADDLTLKRVMLSSGGVGYFEYAASVEGDAVLGLDVPLEQVDDILKSLVVFDAAGSVVGVELPGRDSTVEAFAGVPFGPQTLQSPLAYLNALRGMEVTVAGPRPMTGRLIGAETVTEMNGTISAPRTRVSLLSADGLRQFVLEDAEAVRVTDPTLRARIQNSLESLGTDANQTTRHLTIRVKGKTRRVVSAGYVAGAPLWKATYRLMMDPAPASTARLQGWATLENRSGADWKGVELTLQYGNPVTFRQALYRSYFVDRPEVPVEIMGKILPDIDTRARLLGAQTESAAAPMPAPFAPAPASAPMMMKHARRVDMAAPADIAIAQETGDETIFTLAQPVDLASGHSANVPIIDHVFPAQRIGLVPFRQPHPVSSIRFRNDDSRSLPAGVLTVYDSGAFTGDARLGGLPASEDRLLSFSQDLRTTVETRLTDAGGTISGFAVADGVLTYTRLARQALRVTITGAAREKRDLLIEIPKATADQTLTLEDPKLRVTEQTASANRIAVSLAAGETREIKGWLDTPEITQLALVNGDETELQTVIAATSLTGPGREGLNRVLDLRRAEAGKTADLERKTKLLNDIQVDEDRLRKNLASVTAGDALRTRLTRALDADETKIEQTRQAIDEASAEAGKAHRAVADAIAALKP